MEQKELENRARRIFEDQGFDVEEEGNVFHASRDGGEKTIQAFSSGSFSADEVEKEAAEGAIVFVDEGLAGLEDELENEVSVLRDKEDTQEYDLPSYEVIGDVAVINEIGDHDPDETVEGILEYNPHIKTVLLKQEPLSGEYRVGDYEVLHGGETETTHTEFGCRYRVDVTAAYFSERLATERKRVVDRIEEGEHVLVIGAGVGPYPILAVRESDPERVVAVEKNPAAFRYLEDNIELNNVGGTVEAVKGDARDVTPDEKFDRVIVAIPEHGEELLETAFRHTQDNGVIHYYRFVEDGERDEIEEEIEDVLGDSDAGYDILGRAVCGERGPSVQRVCADIRIER